MQIRLPLGAALLALAAGHLVEHAPTPALAITGAAVGGLLIVTEIIDTLWPSPAREMA